MIIGADISLYHRLREHGAQYSQQGVVRPLPELLVENGFNYARLRLFHSPHGKGAQVNDLEYTIRLAAECKAAGLRWMLCLHYSDTWADPGKQNPPRAWQSLNFPDMVQEIHTYTATVMEELHANGVIPDMIQVGNEITPGMLWDHGKVANPHNINDSDWTAGEFAQEQESWHRLAQLLESAISAIRNRAGYDSAIMIHIDRGGDQRTAASFFDKLNRWDLSYEAIGLSYYPFWHGPLNNLRETIRTLHERTGKEIFVAETAFPHRMHPIYAEHSSAAATKLLDLERTRPIDYPVSPEGQLNYLLELRELLEDLRPKGASGLFYWAPEWIPVMDSDNDEPDAAPCHARALFDKNGQALPALRAFLANIPITV